MINLNHLVFDHRELERLGAADLSSLEELTTVCLVRNHPWDLSLKVLRRQNPFKPGPNIPWQDQVLAAADTMMSLVLRDHLEEGIVNFPVTVAQPEPCTITFEIKFVAHAERDVKILTPPSAPAPAQGSAPTPPVAPPRQPPVAPQQPARPAEPRHFHGSPQPPRAPQNQLRRN